MAQSHLARLAISTRRRPAGYRPYVHDRECGPAFGNIGTDPPHPVTLSLNGHECVNNSSGAAASASCVDNGFLACTDAAALKATCDALGPDVQTFFHRWSHRLPWPMTPADRAAGYDHRLALNQLDVSLTPVFDRLASSRVAFFYAKRPFRILWPNPGRSPRTVRCRAPFAPSSRTRSRTRQTARGDAALAA